MNIFFPLQRDSEEEESEEKDEDSSDDDDEEEKSSENDEKESFASENIKSHADKFACLSIKQDSLNQEIDKTNSQEKSEIV